VCGGCSSQDLAYSDQIIRKDIWLKGIFASLVSDSVWQPFLAMAGEPYHFRNKIRFGFVQSEEGVKVARHAKRTTESDIPVDTCLLAQEEAFHIAQTVASLATTLKWSLYRPHAGGGWLKHVLIRQSFASGEFLVSLVTDSGQIEGEEQLIDMMKRNYPKVVGLFHTVTWGKSAEPLEDRLLYGQSTIIERVGERQYQISLHAFFQTNARMVETLYTTIRSALGTEPIGSLWDLYAGSATIGLFLHDWVSSVLCIENNPSNIADASKNIELNAASNIELVGDSVEAVMTSTFLSAHPSPQCIIVDPPRAGLSKDALHLLLNTHSPRIIYVSCNPVTCRRDLAQLSQFKYTIVSLQGLDCFPHSDHCEMIAVLQSN
jgi:23S rRNA (uracil-5-)-methyltransferase RumA